MEGRGMAASHLVRVLSSSSPRVGGASVTDSDGHLETQTAATRVKDLHLQEALGSNQTLRLVGTRRAQRAVCEQSSGSWPGRGRICET